MFENLHVTKFSAWGKNKSFCVIPSEPKTETRKLELHLESQDTNTKNSSILNRSFCANIKVNFMKSLQ